MEKRERPDSLKGTTIKIQTGCGSMFVVVNVDEGDKIFEVFCVLGKEGGCSSAQCEAIGRLISLYLRSGGPVERIIRQLSGIHCHQEVDGVTSCSDAIAKVLQQVIKNEK